MHVISISEIPVMYLGCSDVPAGIPAAFHEMISRVPSMANCRVYGVFMSMTDYWAAVERLDGDDSATLRLEFGTIPGGAYATAEITDWQTKNLPDIMPAIVRKLAEKANVDSSRPCVEDYVSETKLIVMLPVQ